MSSVLSGRTARLPMSDRAYRTARSFDWTRSCNEFTRALEAACELKLSGQG